MRFTLFLLLTLLQILPAHAQVSLEKKNETCAGRKDGSITVVVNGLPGPFDYAWENLTTGNPIAQNTASLTGLAPGDYRVTVSTQGGACMDVKVAKIWPGKDLTASISARLLDVNPKPLPCGARPVFTYELTAGVSGGTPPFYCSWGASGGNGVPVGGGGTGGLCTKIVTGSNINETVVVIDSARCVDSEGFKMTAANKICPYDPNDITGPDGYDTSRWVAVGQTLDYAVRFENDPVFATANAAVVLITVPIDDDVDPFSFRLGSMGFGDKIIDVPANRASFQQRIDYCADLGLWLDVTAGLDLPNNRYFWLFETIDPLTGQPPLDPAAGFLPVNDTLTGSGEGFVQYFCKPKSTTLTGEIIDQQASIVFDLNEPLLTNTWTNTVDAFAPTTLPAALPDTLYTNMVPFAWSVNDDPGGCGVQYTRLLLSTDNAGFETNGSFVGMDSVTLALNWGNTYYYKIVGTDHVDQTEVVASDSFFIIPQRTLEFTSPDARDLCLDDTLWVGVTMVSIDSADLYISADSGMTYTLLASGISAWPYPLALDSSLLDQDLFLKAVSAPDSVEAISIPFTVRPLPAVEILPPEPGCANDILFVEAMGSNQFLWWPDSIVGDPTARYSNVYADISQFVWVQGTDVYGCRGIDSAWLTVYPVIVDSVELSLCEGDSLWLNGAWVQDTGYYSMTFANMQGCDSTLVSHVVFESPCIWAGGPYVYVDEDAAGANDGSSWTDAFNSLADAIHVAGRYENVREIWVAEGVYTPHPTRRDTSFILTDSIKIYGGFLGIENDRSERTSNAGLVRLSGDINLPDTTWDNSYHVVVIDSSCVDCALDGLTIAFGYADEPAGGHDAGGGMRVLGTVLAFNIVLEDHHADGPGAAVLAAGYLAHVIFEGCQFRLNTSTLGRQVTALEEAEILFRGMNMVLP
jgi:hypothetical protein